ncbi:MAG: type II secretion system F family protein [Patescibacteria group bacterium]
MATYIYEAFNKEGKIIKGELDSRSKKDVSDFLENKKLVPVIIQEKGEIREVRRLSFVIFERITIPDRIFFLRNLAAMVKAGLGMMEALDILILDTEKEVMKKILTTAKFNLEKGQPLSATFSYYKKYFSPIFIGLIKAGEISGRLEESLEELVQHLVRDYGLRKKVKSALAYPFILLVASVGVIFSLLFFILPRLTVSLKRSGAELPAITKAVLSASNALVYSPLLDLILFAAAVWFFVYFRKTRIGRRIFAWMIFKTPIVRSLVKKIALIRFARTLGSLVESGIGIVEALELSAQAVGNDMYERAIMDSLRNVQNGNSLSNSLRQNPKLFPHLLVNMMAVGERTGSLSDVLKNFSNFYEEEVDNALKDLITFLEPILLLIMGLIIGVIAISILLPIYQLVGKFA